MMTCSVDSKVLAVSQQQISMMSQVCKFLASSNTATEGTRHTQHPCARERSNPPWELVLPGRSAETFVCLSKVLAHTAMLATLIWIDLPC